MTNCTLVQKVNVPTIAVIGSFENQLDFINALVNSSIAKSIMNSARDSLPVSIPFDILLDDRIKEDAIQINTKPFEVKTIHATVIQVLSNLFTCNGYKADRTINAITEQEFRKILKSKDYSYSLEKVADRILVKEFKEAVFSPLKAMEEMKIAFQNRVVDKGKIVRRKIGNQTKATIKEIVFDEVWNELKPEVTEGYWDWLSEIGEIVTEYFSESVCNLSAKSSTVLFDAAQPFNLIVRDFTLACSPRELCDFGISSLRVNFRFAPFRHHQDFMQALDFSFNNDVDGILVALDFKKQGSKRVSEIIAEKINRVKLKIPIHVVFTGVSNTIDSFVNRHAEDLIMVCQKDYDRCIVDAISEVERAVAECSCALPVDSVSIHSFRFFAEQIDPVQKAVRDQVPEKLNWFTPKGFYEEVSWLVQDVQMSLCLEGISKCPSTTIKLSVDFAGSGIAEQIIAALTINKEIVNTYFKENKFYYVSGRDVVDYYKYLQNGQGYVCDGFCINMKGCMRRALRSAIPTLVDFFDLHLVQTDEQLLPLFRKYFNYPDVYSKVLNAVAFRLSYGNSLVRSALDKAYRKQACFASTLFSIQQAFKQVFSTIEFKFIIAEEFSAVMTEFAIKAFAKDC